MVKEIHVEGLEKFMEEVNKYGSQTVFALFCGSPDAQGQSWCPDCVAAEPVIEEAKKNIPADAVFIHCGVGARDFWKDPKCVFRTHEKLKLKTVPTLMKWNSPQRLEEEQCVNLSLVQMMFEED